MNNQKFIHRQMLSVIFAAWAGAALSQTVRYVWTNSLSPDGQYLTWDTAATNIQDAINAAAAGDIIIVTNGVYDTGGVSNYPTGYGLTNRVAIHKPVTVRSVNGPDRTAIVGRWHVPGDTNNCFGSNAVRCIYMTNGSALIGFTISNGATTALGDNERLRNGGGIMVFNGDAIISNCVIINCRAANNGGGACGGRYYNCHFIRCMAGVSGGGGGDGWLAATNGFYNCVFSNNYAASQYGGVWAGRTLIVSNCEFVANSAYWDGGGAGGSGSSNGRYYNCIFHNNTASRNGGAVSLGSLFNCNVFNNTAVGQEGGTFWTTTISCIISNNFSGANRGAVGASVNYNCLIIGNQNGGVRDSSSYNCTIVGNHQWGVQNGAVYNSIIWSNQANYAGGITFSYSCTIPAVAGWPEGNITNAPLFINPGHAAAGYGTNYVIGDYHLRKDSPCISKGAYYGWMAPGDAFGRDRDLDGGPRIRHGAVDMGAYETRLSRGTVFSAE